MFACGGHHSVEYSAGVRRTVRAARRCPSISTTGTIDAKVSLGGHKTLRNDYRNSPAPLPYAWRLGLVRRLCMGWPAGAWFFILPLCTRTTIHQQDSRCRGMLSYFDYRRARKDVWALGIHGLPRIIGAVLPGATSKPPLFSLPTMPF